jgi:hypothetical protein
LNRLADIAFAIVLLLNLTGLFRFIAPQVGVDIGTVSIALLIVQVGYLALNHPVTIDLLRKPFVWLWLTLVVLWPFVTGLYAPEFHVRDYGLQAYYATLLLASAVFVARVRWQNMRMLIGASIAVTLVGLLLSLLAPGYFADVNAMLRGNEVEYIQDRAFGFFMQPNRAAYGVILLFTLWFSDWRAKDWRRQLVTFLVMLAGVGLTTSRAGIAIGVGLIAVILWSRESIGGSRRSFSERQLSFYKAMITYVTIILLGFGAAVWGDSLLSNTASGGLNDKLFFWTNVDSVADVEEDGSMQSRLRAQENYLQLVKRRPLRGYGLGSISSYRDLGVLTKSSHNLFVERAFEFGALYILLLGIALYKTYAHEQKIRFVKRVGLDIPLILGLFVLVTGMTTNALLDIRYFYCIVGFVIGGLVYPGIVEIERPGR